MVSERGTAADRGETPGGAAVKLQLRRAAAADDLDVAPQHPCVWPVPSAFIAASLAAKRPAKWMAGHAPAHAVGDFAVGEDAPQEPVAVALDGVGDAGDVGGVESEADDVRHRSNDTATA